jgi:hypothetical protein
MISLEDCVTLSGLEADEVAAISEHEHVPEMAAAALARSLLDSAGGAERIRLMIEDDIDAALAVGRLAHARELSAALRRFVETHLI